VGPRTRGLGSEIGAAVRRGVRCAESTAAGGAGPRHSSGSGRPGTPPQGSSADTDRWCPCRQDPRRWHSVG
jgi:hypothetical protein